VAAIALALCASLSWGVGDFLGGFTSRRLRVLAVLALSQLAGLLGVSIWVIASSDPAPEANYLLAAAGAGVGGAVGLASLYRGMAIGAIGLVAPISAVSPVVAIAVDLARGVAPSTLQGAGIVVALAGIVLASREPVPGGTRVAAGVGLALLAALGFGLFFVGLDAAADESLPWAVAVARGSSCALAFGAVLATRTSLGVGAPLVPAIVAVGLADVAANVLFGLATTRGLLSVVAVLSALYPIVTVALARFFLGEQMSGVQRAGAFTALGGAALIAAG